MYVPNSMFSLQSTLSSTSQSPEIVRPHHPITCTGDLRYNEDNSTECDHCRVAPDDHRMGQVLNHTVAILLMECAAQKFGF